MAKTKNLNVLFVDDEPALLEAYRRSAATLCPEWQVFLSGSGEDALELLKTTAIDVVITDILMQGGMDGTELHREIIEDFPSIIRIVLSGRIDGTAIVESAKYSEIHLCKPAPMTLIRKHVERAVATRDRDRRDQTSS